MTLRAKSFAQGFKPGWPAWVAVAVTLCATNITNIDDRGTAAKPLRISLPRMSPALAAFEDLGKEWTVPTVTKAAPAVEVKLMSGRPLLDILSSIRPAAINVEALMASYLSRIPMGGRISVQLRPAVQVEPQKLAGLVIRQPKMDLPDARQPRSVALNEDRFIPNRSEVSRAERDQIVRDLQASDWRQPDLNSAAQKLIEREKINPNAGVRQLGNILVASPTAESATPQTPFASPMPPSSPLAPTKSEPVASISWAGSDSGPSRSAVLSGTIQLTGGLAITDARQQLVVFRQMEGLKLEKARVWLDEGRFEVSVRSMRGQLVGQLQDSRGRVLGNGEIRLAQLKVSDASDRIEDLHLRVSPTVFGAKVDVLSVHSYDRFEQAVPGAQVWLMGSQSALQPDSQSRTFSEAGLHAGSSFIAQASADNHWGTIVVGLAGEMTSARLFPNKMMDALLGLTLGESRSQAQESSGVIWGRVLQNGHPLTGASVEMAGDHRNQAHYFNSLLLPDRFAEATGENGTFAFVWVTPGIQSVRVIYRGQSYPAQVIPVERGNVSYMEFDIGHMDSVPFALHDPFDAGKELSALVRWAGDESSEVDVQGRGSLKIPTGPGLMTVEVDAGDLYELTRHTVARNSRAINLDTVRRDWLMTLLSRKRINLGSGVGLIVGFKMDENFTVRLDSRGDAADAGDIVYFDANGQALFSDEGVIGGGFAIFNVPLGIQTVSISTGSSPAVHSELVVATPEAVNVISSVK